MKFGDDNMDFSGVDDRRDGRGGSSPNGSGGIGPGHVAAANGISKLLGGGAGLTIVILLVLVMCSVAGGGDQAVQPQQQRVDNSAFGVPKSAEGVQASLARKCPVDAQDGVYDNPDCLLVKSYNETNNVWSQALAGQGSQFRTPKLTFFDGATRTACGPGTTNMGPFYCPADERIYFDLGFNRELQRLGVRGQYALVYIMAHEYGHHLQNVLGIERRVRMAQTRDRRAQNNYSVAMELQADCFAGVWGRLANDQGNVQITPQDFQQAADAAAAVGDDKIMAGAGMRVNPDNFTHGSAKQRQYWYTTGYNSGDINSCNTFQQLGLPL